MEPAVRRLLLSRTPNLQQLGIFLLGNEEAEEEDYPLLALPIVHHLEFAYLNHTNLPLLVDLIAACPP